MVYKNKHTKLDRLKNAQKNKQENSGHVESAIVKKVKKRKTKYCTQN